MGVGRGVSWWVCLAALCRWVSGGRVVLGVSGMCHGDWWVAFHAGCVGRHCVISCHVMSREIMSCHVFTRVVDKSRVVLVRLLASRLRSCPVLSRHVM